MLRGGAGRKSGEGEGARAAKAAFMVAWQWRFVKRGVA